MEWISILAVGPIAFWFLAAVSALELALKHPGEDYSTFDYAFKGHLFFDESNFAHTGSAAYRRMTVGMLGFILSAGLLVAGAALFLT